MATIEIDGKQIEVKDGSTIIQAADEHGVYIPRFCYHKKLSVAANCRMCLVEVEKAPKTLPACATPVSDGMKVFTRSQKTMDSQKAVMEFLLINHPLDCPVCDQGGQCELQDLAMGYGSDASKYTEKKRSVLNKDLGPLVSTEMTRCIHCTRCVRFGEEVAGLRELGMVHRGEDSEIDTYVKHSLQSELSGNIVDICPVGALTSKPFRFAARAWEMESQPSIAAHDCLGSNIYYNTLRRKVKRVLPRENEEINEVWLSDRDRFSYTALSSEHRLLKPMVKQKGKWQEVDWQTAFDVAVKGISRIIRDNPQHLGALLSANSTTEEAYLMQRLMSSLGSHNIDYRLRALSVDDKSHLGLHDKMQIKIADVEKQQAIFLLGANVRHEQPLLGLRVRKAFLNGANITSLNMRHNKMTFKLAADIVVQPKDFVTELARIVKAACEITKKQVPSVCDKITASEDDKLIAQSLCDAEHASILLGAYVESHPFVAAIHGLAHHLAEVTGASFNVLMSGANSQGNAIAGMICEQTGLDCNAMLKNDLAGFILLNVEPELDCADQVQAFLAMQQAGFVVAMTTYASSGLKQYADVLLPVAASSETSGSFVNTEGVWQRFKAANVAQGDSRPAWKILRVLANLLELDGFNYNSSSDVLAEIRASLQQQTELKADYSLPQQLPSHADGLQLMMVTPMYAADNCVRCAGPLQQLISNTAHCLSVNEHTAQTHKLVADKMAQIKLDGKSIKLKVVIDNDLPDETVQLASGFHTTTGFGRAYALVEVIA